MLTKGSTAVCQLCGNAFTVKNPHNPNHYCSNTCSAIARGALRRAATEQSHGTCAQCGKTFYARRYAIEKRGRRFCSIACRNVASRQITAQTFQACETCNKPFRIWPGALERNTRFCSRACFAVAKRTGSTCVCETCGVTFYATVSMLETGRRYCSQPCAHTARRDESRRDRGSWQHRQWRIAVLERDNFTCQECGSAAQPLHAHHIKAWARHLELRFEIDNGVTLCHACHAAKHPHVPKLAVAA